VIRLEPSRRQGPDDSNSQEREIMKLVQSILVAAAVAAAAPAYAQFAKPEDAAKYRQSVMFLQGQHAGRINAQLKSDKPDMKAIADNAVILDTVNKLFFTAFTPGSDMVANTRAKPEIWTNQAKFKEYAEKVNAEVARLASAAKAGDLAATRAAFGDVGKACKACHDDFRKD
jgi:cytochrome c556